MSNKVVVDVSEEDRIFIENVCEQTHQTFTAFFKYMLDEYRKKHGFKKNCKSAEFNAEQNASMADELEQIEKENKQFSEIPKKNDKLEDSQDSINNASKGKKTRK